MSDKINRRKILKAAGVATAVKLNSASIVAAGGSPENNPQHSFSLPDLRIRSYLKKEKYVMAKIIDRKDNSPIVEKRIKVDKIENDKIPDTQDFMFNIPQGRYRIEITSNEHELAKADLTAPEEGYPDHRGFYAQFEPDSLEIFEEYI